MSKPNTERKAKFAELSAASGGVFVFASRDPNLPSLKDPRTEIASYAFAAYNCASCSTVFQGIKADGLKPHCVSCGSSEQVKASVESVKQPNIPANEQLAYLACRGCGSFNVLASETASAVKGVHCVVCGTENPFKTTASGDLVMTSDMDFDTDISDLPSDDTQDLDDMELVDVDSEQSDDLPVAPETDMPMANTTASDTEAPDNPPSVEDRPAPPPNSTDTDVHDAEPKPATTPGVADDSTQLPAGESPSNGGTNFAPGSDAETMANADEMPNNDYGYDADSDSVDVDMMDVTDASAEQLAFVYSGKNVSIAAGNKIVATLTPETAGANTDILQTEHFRKAVGHSIATLGLKKALANYGFQTAKVRVPVAQVIKTRVESAVQERTAELSAKLAEVTADFQQALDIAAAGYIANFWRNRQDPVRAALVQELETAGLKSASARRLVDRVYAAHGVAQQREILALARELAGKSVETRNELAASIDLAKYQPTSVQQMQQIASDVEDEDDDSDDDGEPEEASRVSIATALPSFEQTASGPVASTGYKSPLLQRILGDKPLFNTP